MQLNELRGHPAARKNKKRVGRGDKTAGRGHKGQLSRSGGSVPARFEGGQMPIQMRLPKFGETSMKSLTHAKLRVSELRKVPQDIRKIGVGLDELKLCGLIRKNTTSVKVFLSGVIDFAIKLKGLRVSKGARVLIDSNGGSVE
jgi:large subunit ribosomal protein L15